jgi:uncharacterized membrane protein (DUF2068 family)
MTGLSTQIKTNPKSHRAGLVMIAGYKLLVAIVCIGIGVGALHLVGKDIDDVFSRLTTDLRLPESRFVNFMFDKIELLDDPMLKRIGFAAFCYASLGIIEAVGLYLEKAWGEIITLVVTASFLPFEVHEMMRRLTWLRTGLFVINLVVLIYLVWMLGEKAAERRRSADA